MDGLKLQIGQPVQAVQNSKFCLGPLLSIHKQIREIARRRSAQTDTQGTPSLQNDIPYKNSNGAQHLDQES